MSKVFTRHAQDTAAHETPSLKAQGKPQCKHCGKAWGWKVDFCPFCGKSPESPAVAQPATLAPPFEPAPVPPSKPDSGQQVIINILPLGDEKQIKEKGFLHGDAEYGEQPPPPPTLPKKPTQTKDKHGNGKTQPPAITEQAILVMSLALVACVLAGVWLYQSRQPVPEPAMVYIPEGDFVIGSPASETGRNDDERQPDKPIHVNAFYLGQYEVTFEEYDRFATEKGLWGHEGKGREPVRNIRWKDAYAYAEWLSEKTGKHYRLPTEAEWEYAARLDKTTGKASASVRYWGDGVEQTCRYANIKGCTDNIAEVKPQKRVPTSFGLYDMLGNVSEMTASVYVEHYDGSEQRPADFNDPRDRAVRGGSWLENEMKYMRVSTRYNIEISTENPYVGFRIAHN